MADEEMDDYYLILKEMKSQENNYIESILILMDDAVLRNSVIAWQTIKCIRIPKSNKEYKAKCSFTLSYDKWNWLWSQTIVDEKHFAVVANVKVQEINNLFVRMAALRLIYPDNTISSVIKGFLRNTIKTKFPQPKENKNRPIAPGTPSKE